MKPPSDYRAPTGLPASNMRSIRVGLFVGDLAALLDHLSPAEFVCFMRFRVEYTYAGACGLVDDDRYFARRLRYKAWRALKAKLLTMGYLSSVGGVLIDKDLSDSVQRQRDTKARQTATANKRWKVDHIGGAA